MTRSELAARIDHTVLKPDTTSDQVARVCEEARICGFAAVCIAPRHVPLAAERLKGAHNLYGPIHVATVVGFPHGDTLSKAKGDEARRAIDAGATELDMVLPIGAALEGDWDAVRRDIEAVVHAANGLAIIKVILETAYFNPTQIARLCQIAEAASADYVKTSTGFAARGAELETVKLMRESVSESIGVKAAGGIRDAQTALAMLEAGATRLGCSASVVIVTEVAE